MITKIKRFVAVYRLHKILSPEADIKLLYASLLLLIVLGINSIQVLLYYKFSGYSKIAYDLYNLISLIVWLFAEMAIIKIYVRADLPEKYKEIYGKY